nr:glutathione peroxidase [Nocardioidaceae bacterium]
TQKVDVNGDDRHPVYQVLTVAPDGEGEDADVQWNFEKFLLDTDGSVVARYRPGVAPDDPALTATIESLLD